MDDVKTLLTKGLDIKLGSIFSLLKCHGLFFNLLLIKIVILCSKLTHNKLYDIEFLVATTKNS